MKLNETAKEAASILTAGYTEDGYKGTGLYEYIDERANPVFWRIRAEHPDKGEIVLPMAMINGEWKLEEPVFENGRPLYNLESLLKVPKAIVLVVEDEGTADFLIELGMIATTSGGTLSETDWTPLRGRMAKVLYFSRERVSAYLKTLPGILTSLDCEFMVLDVYPGLLADLAEVPVHVDGDCTCCGVEIMDKNKLHEKQKRDKKRKTPIELPLFTPDMLN
jgi:putative DNA primase/helicase